MGFNADLSGVDSLDVFEMWGVLSIVVIAIIVIIVPTPTILQQIGNLPHNILIGNPRNPALGPPQLTIHQGIILEGMTKNPTDFLYGLILRVILLCHFDYLQPRLFCFLLIQQLLLQLAFIKLDEIFVYDEVLGGCSGGFDSDDDGVAAGGVLLEEEVVVRGVDHGEELAALEGLEGAGGGGEWRRRRVEGIGTDGEVGVQGGGARVLGLGLLAASVVFGWWGISAVCA